MAYITARDANAWADKFKLNLTALDDDLEVSVASQVLARVSQRYDTSAWLTPETTPSLIKSIIAMMYTGWYFQRVYSEDTDISTYGALLLTRAEDLIDGIVSGSNILVEEVVIGGADTDTASFYPNDLSSAQSPTFDDMSLGGPKFTMGQIW
jgi:hypothetical protein